LISKKKVLLLEGSRFEPVFYFAFVLSSKSLVIIIFSFSSGFENYKSLLSHLLDLCYDEMVCH